MLTTKQQADLIKAELTMADILTAYGFDGNARHRRIPCPIHNGTDKNFSFTDFGWQCFTCGAHGGLVNFVEQYLECRFEDALADINRKFRLWGQDIDKPLTYSDVRKRQKKIKERNIQKALKDHRVQEWETARLEIARLDANKIRFAPKTPEDGYDERYVEACHHLDGAIYQVESMGRR